MEREPRRGHLTLAPKGEGDEIDLALPFFCKSILGRDIGTLTAFEYEGRFRFTDLLIYRFTNPLIQLAN